MGLAAPLFLFGLAAIALPLWLHRLQTQSSDRKPFSSAMLLETAEEQIHVRKKLKYLLLLSARILLLVLIAFAFAKPFIEVPPDVVESTEAGTVLVVVDTSASMGRAGVLQQAQSEANRAIADAPADALLQLASAEASLELIGSLTSDRAAARSSVQTLSSGSLRLDYGEMMSALERVAASLPPPVRVHFVSDFQSSAMPVRFSDVVAGGVAEFVPHVVGTGDPFNWSFEFVRDSGDGIEVGITGAGDRERIGNVALILNGEVVETRGLSQTGPQTLHFDAPEYETGQNRLHVRIDTDDDFRADNDWYHVVDRNPPAPIPLITRDPGGLPMTYLRAALESAGAWEVEPLVAGDFDERVLSRHRWLVIDDLGLVDPQLETALLAFLEDGGNVLAFAGERAASLETVPVSGHRQSPASTVPTPGEFLAVGQVDTTHPVLSQTEGWHSVNITRSMALEVAADDEVLIRLDNNEPFLIERPVGAGRLLLVPANLDNQWNDLPARPVFVSFMIESARYLSGVNDIARTYVAGATLPLAATGATAGQVVDPDGNTVLSLADTTREQQIKLNKPGFYEVYNREGQTVVAANIDPRESDLSRISQDVLDLWQDSSSGQAAAGAAGYAVEEAANVELWHWLLLILALVVIGESILGNMHLAPRSMERA